MSQQSQIGSTRKRASGPAGKRAIRTGLRRGLVTPNLLVDIDSKQEPIRRVR
ncbi:hypothetical protein [Salinibacterium sp.]|uniref:hypothetical protein n=1 Tax=Salinibacterium sp. TaxID=1915057 RepID=UPI00286AA48C|nr:hypothetical protein [Salinibacterium sp.]